MVGVTGLNLRLLRPERSESKRISKTLGYDSVGLIQASVKIDASGVVFDEIND
jgi:hypothetical protein